MSYKWIKPASPITSKIINEKSLDKLGIIICGFSAFFFLFLNEL